MELKSEPKYETVNVTDIDIAFPGDLQTFCLRGEDTYFHSGDMMTMTLNGGKLVFQLNHAHWWAIKQRTIRVLSPATPPVQEG